MAMPLHGTSPQELIPTVKAVSKSHPGPKDIKHLPYPIYKKGTGQKEPGAL